MSSLGACLDRRGGRVERAGTVHATVGHGRAKRWPRDLSSPCADRGLAVGRMGRVVAGPSGCVPRGAGTPALGRVSIVMASWSSVARCRQAHRQTDREAHRQPGQRGNQQDADQPRGSHPRSIARSGLHVGQRTAVLLQQGRVVANAAFAPSDAATIASCTSLEASPATCSPGIPTSWSAARSSTPRCARCGAARRSAGAAPTSARPRYTGR
jgi:hypothetical protein